MKKATIYQRSIITNCQSDGSRLIVWQEMGFTEEEARMMVRGRTISQANLESGGCWQVGNVEYPQAISREHALKIHIWNFGKTETANLVKTDHQGLTWIIDRDPSAGLQGMDDQTYNRILNDTVAIQYLIIAAGGMATKTAVENILMLRYNLDRGDAHTFTNLAESRQDFMIVNGRVVWQAKHRCIPQIEDYPEIQND